MSGLAHTFSSETAQQPADCSPPIKSKWALTRFLPLTIKMFEMGTLFLIHDDYPPKAPLPGHGPIQGWLMTLCMLILVDGQVCLCFSHLNHHSPYHHHLFHLLTLMPTSKLSAKRRKPLQLMILWEIYSSTYTQGRSLHLFLVLYFEHWGQCPV